MSFTVTGDGEQCPECRAPEGTMHNVDCCFYHLQPNGYDTYPPKPVSSAVPWYIQQHILNIGIDHASKEAGDLLWGEHDRIVEMARERHTKGYDRFGSEMYEWTPEQRLTNILEELADALVYITSGPLPEQGV